MDASPTETKITPEPEREEKTSEQVLAEQPLVEASDQEVRDSTYEPQNNLGAPPNKTELDSPNRAAATRIRHRAGAANYSFDVPFASLPGRGIDAAVGMTYNSRVWNKTGDGPTASYTFNVDQNWLAPGFTVGYGNLKSRFWSERIYLPSTNQFKTFNEVIPDGVTDSNGTRHQFACAAEVDIPGTAPGNTYGLPTKHCSEYETTDGSFIKLTYYGSQPISSDFTNDMSAYSSTYFLLTYPDGTRVTYSVPGSQFASNDWAREHYPTQIQDANGNQIDIAYKNGKNSIDYIRDTVGRLIKFYYEPTDDTKLLAVTVPGLDGTSERQTIRFYYETLPLTFSNRLSGYAIGPATYRALRYVYFLGTGTGYRYDYDPDLGMITRIAKLTGMSVTGETSLDSPGSVNTGVIEAASTEYLYPNDGSQTPLTDVPKFTQRTDTWQDVTTRTAITHYDSPEPATGTDRIAKVTVEDTDFDVEYATVSNNTTDWLNGLPKETSATKIYGPSGQYRMLMTKTVYSWKQGIADANGRRLPVLEKAEIINDAGQVRATSFDYDGYNNQTKVIEHDFAAAGQLGTELRRIETKYETGLTWINNRMVRLPVEVKTIVNNATVSKTVYEYDNYATAMSPTSGVVQHNAAYDASWSTRGNVTKVIAFADASAPTEQPDPKASVRTMTYDITGNVVGVAGVSCCNVKAIEYDPQYQYAYATKETKGSSEQVVTKAAYSLYTGLVTKTWDENDEATTFTYDPATLRQTRVDYPNGAWTTIDFNDATFPYFVKSTSSLDAGRSTSSWTYVNGAGQTFRTRSQTADGYMSNDVELDNMGRLRKTFNPYTVAGLAGARPADIKYTEVTQIDALGRVLETKLTDNTMVSIAFNTQADTPANLKRTFVTITDQAGKKRRQLADALGRIVRVDEPDSSGNLGAADSPTQPTDYQFDGNDNLTKVTQSIPGGAAQVREFVYDSLSHLLRERQVEASPTLDVTGVHGSVDSTKWTGVYEYTPDGLLDYSIDARGVKTDFTYDGLNRIWKIDYTGETGYTTPKVVYTYSEARNDPSNNQPYQNVGRLTTVETLETLENATQGTPKTIQKYDYDSVGQVKRHVQTIGTQEYSLEYGYNLAGQLTSEKYPSGKVVTTSVDNFGVMQTVADSQKTYLTGLTINSKGQLSQMNLGNGTSQTFSYNDRLQLESESLLKGTSVLQKYNYNYGDLDSTGALKNNGKLEQIESFIGSSKQWTQNFKYDSVGRLKEAAEKRGDTNALSYKQVFDYDRFGNLYRKTGSNPTAGQNNPLPTNWIEDAQIDKSKNQFLAWTGVTYDEAGQITTDTKFRNMNFGYDANGRMVNVHSLSSPTLPDSKTVYDALGNRVATKINDVWQYMIYDAFGQLVAEYGLPSEGIGGVKFIQQDHQGSVRAVTDAHGNVVSRSDYQAFGDEIGAGVGLRSSQQGYGGSVARQGYGLTEKDDATGQQHTWFRKLETQAGRWSSPDPYNGSMDVSNPQSFNRFAYVNNDPTDAVDPSGLMPNCGPDETPMYDPTINAVVCVKTPSGSVTIRADEPPLEAGPMRLIYRRTGNRYGDWLELVPKWDSRLNGTEILALGNYLTGRDAANEQSAFDECVRSAYRAFRKAERSPIFKIAVGGAVGTASTIVGGNAAIRLGGLLTRGATIIRWTARGRLLQGAALQSTIVGYFTGDAVVSGFKEANANAAVKDAAVADCKSRFAGAADQSFLHISHVASQTL